MAKKLKSPIKAQRIVKPKVNKSKMSSAMVKSDDLPPSHWVYQSEPVLGIPSGMDGFVYVITNKLTQQAYVGRKYFWSVKRVKVAGSSRRKIQTTESDWRTYTGSSAVLNAMISREGKEAFEFEIICMARTRGQVNFLEENIQHKLDVLTATLPNGSRKFYNDAISSRRWIGIKPDRMLSESLQTAKNNLRLG